MVCNKCIPIGNGTLLPIKSIGSVAIPADTRPLSLKNVFHVPSLKQISVRQLCWDNNCSVIFNESSVCVKDKTSGRTLLQASSSGNLYPLHVPSTVSIPALAAFVDLAIVWHRRLGHCGARTLSSLMHSNLISFPNKLQDTCNSCYDLPLYLIHSDLWQSPVLSYNGYGYNICFVDDFSRFT